MTIAEIAGFSPHRQEPISRMQARSTAFIQSIIMKRSGKLLLERIDARLKALSLNDNSASERTGLGRDLIRDLRRNPDRSPKLDTTIALARALECTIDYLIDPDVETVTERPLHETRAAISLDVIGLAGAELWQNPRRLEEAAILGRVKIMLDDNDAERPSYALKVVGDAMNLRAPDGSFAIVSPDEGREPRHGEMVVVRQEKNGLIERSLRRVKRKGDGFELISESTDATFEPLTYDPAKTVIIGVVIWIVQRPGEI